jgi:N-acetylmuramoyl-L-alanine amidase
LTRNFRSIIILALAFIFIFPDTASTEGIPIVRINNADYIPLAEIIASLGFEHTFDMVTQKGKLYRKNHNAVYSVGLSVILVDGSLYKSAETVRRSRGKILFPLDAGQHIIQNLEPGLRVHRRGDAVVVEKIEGEGQISDQIQLQQKSSKDRICFIVIDPGHGGKDPGAVGKGGLEEKDITLKVSQLLAKKMTMKLPTLKIFMTRKDDRFVELSQRTEFANKMLRKNENGVFLSIHVNSSLSNRIAGYETFFLSQNPTNEEARNTAALENNVVILEEKSKSSKKFYDDVDYIEATMITTQILKESSDLAASIQKGQSKNIKLFSPRGVKKADFFVLRGVLMPAALIEIGFITNKKEAQYLRKSSHQELIAEGIADGVELFIKKYNSHLNLK